MVQFAPLETAPPSANDDKGVVREVGGGVVKKRSRKYRKVSSDATASDHGHIQATINSN